MTSRHDSPILVTGAAGDIGAIGRNVTAMLLAKGHRVRALVRREDERAEGLRRLGPTGFELADLEHYARVFSEALGRTIRYRDVPVSGWTDTLRKAGCQRTSSTTSP